MATTSSRIRELLARKAAVDADYDEALREHFAEAVQGIRILSKPLAGRVVTGLFSGTTREVASHILKHLVLEDPEGLFMANPSLDFGDSGVTVLHGHAQLGKSRAMCVLAWSAHFVFDVVPVIFTKLSGGLDAKAQLRRSIAEFNVEIDSIVRDWASSNCRPGSRVLPHELERFHLHAVDKFNPQSFADNRAQVLLRLCGTSNLELVLNGKRLLREGRTITIPSDLETIQLALAGIELGSAEASASAPGRHSSSHGFPASQNPALRLPRSIFVLIDEADLLIQTLGQDRLLGAPLASELPLLRPVSGKSSEIWSTTGLNAVCSATALSSTPSGPDGRSWSVDSVSDVPDEQVVEADLSDTPKRDASEEEIAQREANAVRLLLARRADLIDASFHTVLVTATPSALLLLPRDDDFARRLQVAVLPLRRLGALPYFGYSSCLDPSRQVRHRATPPHRTVTSLPVTDAGIASASQLLARHPGIVLMLNDMLGIASEGDGEHSAGAPPFERVGLVHAEREIDQHTILQREITTHAEKHGASMISITHDTGGGDGWGFSLSASASIITPAKAEFCPQDGGGSTVRDPLVAREHLPWHVIESLDSRGKSIREWTRFDTETGIVHFSSHLQFSDVLDMVQLFRARHKCCVVIITGCMGFRGTTFKSSVLTAFKLHLTDEFVKFGEKASASLIIQQASRICGRYCHEPPPTLQLWCSTSDYHRLQRMVKTEDDIVNVAREAILAKRSPVSALLDKPWPGGTFHRAQTHLQNGRGGSRGLLCDGTLVRPAVTEASSVFCDPFGAHFELNELILRRYRMNNAQKFECIVEQWRDMYRRVVVSTQQHSVTSIPAAKAGASSTDAVDKRTPATQRAASVKAPHLRHDGLFLRAFDASFIASTAAASVALRNHAISTGNVATEFLALDLPPALRDCSNAKLVGDGRNDETSASAIEQWLRDLPQFSGCKFNNLRSHTALHEMKRCPALLAAGEGSSRARGARVSWRWSPEHQLVFVIRRRLEDDVLRDMPIVIWHYFSVPEVNSRQPDSAARFAVGWPFVHIDARLKCSEAQCDVTAVSAKTISAVASPGSLSAAGAKRRRRAGDRSDDDMHSEAGGQGRRRPKSERTLATVPEECKLQISFGTSSNEEAAAVGVAPSTAVIELVSSSNASGLRLVESPTAVPSLALNSLQRGQASPFSVIDLTSDNEDGRTSSIAPSSTTRAYRTSPSHHDASNDGYWSGGGPKWTGIADAEDAARNAEAIQDSLDMELAWRLQCQEYGESS